jgi:hypothetical protein
MSVAGREMTKQEAAAMRQRIHRDVAGAQHALVEARGRLLEACDREDLEAVLSALRSAARHVSDAVKDCAALGSEPRVLR